MSQAEKTFEELGQFISNAMQRYHVPGVAVGVQHDGNEYTTGFGVTNVNHPLPVDGDTLFQIGSTTKTFTATTALANYDLSVNDGTLMLKPIPHGGFPFRDSPPPPMPPPSRLAFIGSDHVIALDPPNNDVHGEFLRNPDGAIVWFRFGGRIRQREA
jgi:hypothetical protein